MLSSLKHLTISIATGLCASLATFATQADELVYFGTRGDAPQGGIYAARFDSATGKLAPLGRMAELPRAGWLALHPQLPVLYSVSDLGRTEAAAESNVYSFAIDRTTGALREMNRVSSGGRGATHLALDNPSKTLFVAHYGSGHISWLPLQPDGSLGIPLSVQSQYGTGPNQQRQSSPHPHGFAIDSANRFVLSTDLGADRTFIYRFDPATRQLTPANPAFVSASPGAGPRHLAFHPNGHFVYLATELALEVVCYRWEPRHGRLRHVQTLRVDEPGETKSLSEILMTRDGRFVYVGYRGGDLIAVYSVDSRTGTLSEVQRIASQGRIPWSFEIDSSQRWMLLANHGSNTVSVFARDPETGKLSPTATTLEVPQPSNVTFVAAGE